MFHHIGKSSRLVKNNKSIDGSKPGVDNSEVDNTYSTTAVLFLELVPEKNGTGVTSNGSGQEKI